MSRRAARDRGFLALAVGLAVWITGSGGPGPLPPAPRLAPPALAAETPAVPRAPLEIEDGRGRRHRFRVEVATTAAQRTRGLMYRTHLAPDEGMLFLYPTPRIIRMWMKDTLLSLDMLFIAADGRIVQVAEHTEPLSLRVIASAVPMAAVLELRAGRCAALGIGPGARIVGRQSGTAPLSTPGR